MQRLARYRGEIFQVRRSPWLAIGYPALFMYYYLFLLWKVLWVGWTTNVNLWRPDFGNVAGIWVPKALAKEVTKIFYFVINLVYICLCHPFNALFQLSWI